MVFESSNDRIPFTRQYVSFIILITNIIVFIIQLFDPTGNMFVYEAAFIPAEFFSGVKVWTIITSMFMHGDFFHILMNMWFFYVVADNCEQAMGHILFAVTYFISGIVASLLHGFISLTDPQIAQIPSLGASGAIFGIMAVYAVLFPNNRLRVLLGFIFAEVKARTYILIYFIIQIVYALLFWAYSPVAYFAHIGGFVTGAVIGFVFKKTSSH